MDSARFIPHKTVDQSLSAFGFDEGYESSNSEIVRGTVHIFAAWELGTFPTSVQTLLDATVSLITHLASVAQLGRILTTVALGLQMTHTTYQTTISNAVYKRLFVH